jgi:tetratricopeptide (TPR) repeat protein
MGYHAIQAMNARMIRRGVAVAGLIGLACAAGCKNESASRSSSRQVAPIQSATSDHGLSPHYEGLIEDYGSVLAEDPDNLAANIAMANAFYDAGEWRHAISYYDRALRLNPHNADVITDRATCYRNLGMTDEAVRDYRLALRVEPTHQNALYNLGIVYAHDKKDLSKAIKYWERLLEVAPKYPRADYLRASIDGFRRSLKKGSQ